MHASAGAASTAADDTAERQRFWYPQARRLYRTTLIDILFGLFQCSAAPFVQVTLAASCTLLDRFVALLYNTGGVSLRILGFAIFLSDVEGLKDFPNA